MKFFTPEVYDSWYGPVDPFEDESVLDAAHLRYREYLQRIADRLPPELLELTRLEATDDGLLVEVHSIHSQGELILVLRCGDLQHGYYDLILHYFGASLSPEDERSLAQLAHSRHYRRSDLFVHELDVAEQGKIEHRFLFHPGLSFAIRCDRLHWEARPRPARWHQAPEVPDRYPGAPPLRERKRLRATRRQ